jgi:hypothetical protein
MKAVWYTVDRLEWEKPILFCFHPDLPSVIEQVQNAISERGIFATLTNIMMRGVEMGAGMQNTGIFVYPPPEELTREWVEDFLSNQKYPDIFLCGDHSFITRQPVVHLKITSIEDQYDLEVFDIGSFSNSEGEDPITYYLRRATDNEITETLDQYFAKVNSKIKSV